MYKGAPLEAMKIILKTLGHPERATKFIHIAGSNGKGSTLNATREILMGHGLQVGAFISPHLELANERITINKVQIKDERFLAYTNRIADIVITQLDGQFPSFFEMVTLIAFQYFEEESVDVAIMETGIGGRLDSTNVLTPEVSIITTISLEHTEMLGHTHALIAAEKAGIIKAGRPVVVGVEHEEARAVIRAKAEAVGAPFYTLHEQIAVKAIQRGQPQTFTFQFEDVLYSSLTLKMAGTHQIHNAALAITAAKLFASDISEGTIRQALANASWEGRFERFSKQIILDGAHNSEGTTALINTLVQTEPKKRYKFIYAALRDKDHAVSIALMDKVAAEMAFTQIELPRAAKAEHLASQSNHMKKTSNPNWQELVEQQLATLQEDELLIITGSLYFIAEVRSYLLQGRGEMMNDSNA